MILKIYKTIKKTMIKNENKTTTKKHKTTTRKQIRDRKLYI